MTEESDIVPEIALSRGDLALVLGGFKTMHYFDKSLTEHLKPGERINFVWGAGSGKITIPVIVGHTAATDPAEPLSNGLLQLTGRFVSKPMREEDTSRRISKQTKEKKVKNQARQSARSFMRAWEPSIPEQLTAADIAGSDHPSLLAFHLYAHPQLSDKEAMRTIRHHYRDAANALAPYMQRAHGYMANGNSNGKEFMPPPNDHSTYLAARFLARHDQGSIKEYIQRMHGAASRLSPQPLGFISPEPKIPHPDGIGQNALLGGSSESISLGRALLLFSGATSFVVTREPLVYANPKMNYPEPVTMRLQALGPASKSGYRKHAVEVPMEIDVAESVTLMTGRISDEKACELGFTDRKALMRELGLKKDANELIYVTPVRGLSRDLPIDTDRLGSYWNKVMDGLHDALINGKNGAHSKRSGLLKTDKNLEPSVREALAFISTLAPEQQQQIHNSVARYWAMDDGARKQWLSHAGNDLLTADPDASMDILAHHQLPGDVRAERAIAPRLAPAEDEQPAPAKKIRLHKPVPAVTDEEPPLPTHGSGWRAPKGWKASKPAQSSILNAMDDETRSKLEALRDGKTEPPKNWQMTISKGQNAITPHVAANNDGPKPKRRSRAEQIRQEQLRQEQRLLKHGYDPNAEPIAPGEARDPLKDVLAEQDLPAGHLTREEYLNAPRNGGRTSR